MSKRHLSRTKKSLIFALFAALVMGCAISISFAEASDRYILVFRDSSRCAASASTSAYLKIRRDEAADALRAVLPNPNRVMRPRLLWVANAAAVTLSPKELERVRRDPRIAEIVPVAYQRWIQPPLEPPDEKAASDPVRFYATEKTRATEVWEKLGIDGSGVLVGHLDSGANPDHPALKGQIQQFRDFTATGSPIMTAYDDQGHGTHTAGCIAGRTEKMGMAPGARLLVARVLDKNGGGYNEDIMAAMQWMLDPDGNPETLDGPRVVSNSWGSSSTTDRLFWEITQTWVKAGIVPVFAAGNNGYSGGKVGVPAAFPHVLAVGATDEKDQWGWFSSLGPAKWDGKVYVKPDVAAPGVKIFSAHWNSDGFNNLSGTSMAAPQVTGLVALMLQANPTMSVDDIVRVIRETAVDLGPKGPDDKFGYGRIDAFAAVQKSLLKASASRRVRVLLQAVQAQDRITADDPHALSERAITGFRSLARTLDDGEWRALETELSVSTNPLERRALKVLQAMRRFGQIHENSHRE